MESYSLAEEAECYDYPELEPVMSCEKKQVVEEIPTVVTQESGDECLYVARRVTAVSVA